MKGVQGRMWVGGRLNFLPLQRVNALRRDEALIDTTRGDVQTCSKQPLRELRPPNPVSGGRTRTPQTRGLFTDFEKLSEGLFRGRTTTEGVA